MRALTGIVTTTTHQPRPTDQVEIRFGIGGAVLVTVSAATIAFRLPDAYVATALLLATGLACLVLSGGFAALLGATGWALVDGFSIHSYGQLGLGGSDLALLGGFVVVAVVAAFLGHTRSASPAGRRSADGWPVDGRIGRPGV